MSKLENILKAHGREVLTFSQSYIHQLGLSSR